MFFFFFVQKAKKGGEIILSLSFLLFALILTAQSLQGVLLGFLDHVHGLTGILNPDAVGDSARAEDRGAARGHEAEGDVGSQAQVAAAGRLDHDELALATTAPGSQVVAAPGLVADGVEVGIVVVEDVDLVVHVEQAERRAAENAFSSSHDGIVPLDGVLSEDDVLGSFDLVQDVLGVGEARQHAHARAHFGSY